MKKIYQNSAGVVSILLLCFLTACASSASHTLPNNSTSVLNPSEPAQDYKIHVGDQLDVKFFYNSELNEQVTVRPDGRIALQLIDEIMVAGLTPSQLTDLLSKKYGSELDKPAITVIVRSFGGQMVYVDGEVNKPGMLNMIAPLTVLQSLSQAGGVKDTAKRNEILIIRRGLDNKPVVLVMNMKKVIDGTETSQDITLMPFDIVYVPKSSIANVNVWVDQYLRKNIPIGVGVYYNLNNGNR